MNVDFPYLVHYDRTLRPVIQPLTLVERPKLSDETTVMCSQRHIKWEKNLPYFSPTFFQLSSKDGVTEVLVAGDRDLSILRVVGILIFYVLFCILYS